MFGQLQKHGLIRFFVGGLGGQASEGLLQRVLRANWKRAQARLEGWHFHTRFWILARFPQLRKEREHGTDVFLRHGVPSRTATCCFRSGAGDAARAQQRRRSEPLSGRARLGTTSDRPKACDPTADTSNAGASAATASGAS